MKLLVNWLVVGLAAAGITAIIFGASHWIETVGWKSQNVRRDAALMVDGNHVARGEWTVSGMDMETIPNYVVVKLTQGNPDAMPNITHGLARPEEGLELGDKALVWEIRIGVEPQYQIVTKIR